MPCGKPTDSEAIATNAFALARPCCRRSCESRFVIEQSSEEGICRLLHGGASWTRWAYYQSCHSASVASRRELWPRFCRKASKLNFDIMDRRVGETPPFLPFLVPGILHVGDVLLRKAARFFSRLPRYFLFSLLTTFGLLHVPTPFATWPCSRAPLHRPYLSYIVQRHCSVGNETLDSQQQ